MVHKHAAEIALTPGKLLYMLYMWGLIRDFPVVSCMVVTLSNQQPPSQRAVNLLPSKSEKRCSVELSVIWTGAVLLPVVTMPGLHISEVQVAGANDCYVSACLFQWKLPCVKGLQPSPSCPTVAGLYVHLVLNPDKISMPVATGTGYRFVSSCPAMVGIYY